MSSQRKAKGSLSQPMHYVANMQAITADNVPIRSIEYQVFTDAHVVGECLYGPYSLQLWEFDLKHLGEQRLLCLRVDETVSEDAPTIQGQESDEGLYHGGGIETEIVALASLFLRARFTLGAMTRLNDKPLMLPKKYVKWVDPQAVHGERDLTHLPHWLSQAANLRRQVQKRFILSAKLYHQGLQLIEEKPDLAYLNLISAIEVLSRDFEVGRSLEDVDAELATLIGEIENENLRQQIETRLADRHISFISLKFRKFILAHVEPNFWQWPKPKPERGEREPVQTSLQVTPDTLEVWLKRIYTQRSQTLHNGEAFPPTAFTPLMQEHGAEFVRDLMTGGRLWGENEVVPHPQFFERLVNHVLMNFVVRNQEAASTPASSGEGKPTA